MFAIMLFTIIIISGLLVFVLAGNETVSAWVKFFARGKDEGFGFREIALLKQAAQKARLEDPMALFWSLKQLNESIKVVTVRAKLAGKEEHPETQNFLSKLYDFRKKLEFEQPRYRKGIQSSRQILESQSLRILLEGAGVYKSRVLRNTDRHLTVLFPEGSLSKGNIVWSGKKVSVYFWRIDDAGYVFDSYVIDEVKSNAHPALQLSHSDSLVRAQKRKSIRAQTSIPAYLYIMAGDEDPHRLETEPGYRCVLKDVSEDGCAVAIGGKANDGLHVRIQFELGGELIAMGGVVKSSEYSEEEQRSLLHIEAFPLPVSVRNRIQAEVFGIQSEEELSDNFSFFDEMDESLDNLEEEDIESAKEEVSLEAEEISEEIEEEGDLPYLSE